MKLQYLGYVGIAIAVYAGIAPWHPGVVLILALFTTFLFSGARAKSRKREVHREKPNMMMEGAFLYAGQVLIMFIAYLIGWFYVNQFGGGA